MPGYGGLMRAKIHFYVVLASAIFFALVAGVNILTRQWLQAGLWGTGAVIYIGLWMALVAARSRARKRPADVIGNDPAEGRPARSLQEKNSN